MKFLSVLLISIFTVAAAAQSRRVAQTIPVSAADRSVKEMFDEANQYRKLKFEEFEAKKLPVNERLRLQTEREQKQLAAKLAASAATRDSLSTDDIYYLALLYWISENLHNTSDTLRKYLESEGRTPDRSQTSRSLLTVIAAKQKRFDEAAATLAEYLKSEPTKPSEKLRMNSEIAKSFLAAGEPAKAIPFAGEAFAISRSLIEDPKLRSVGLDLVYDNAMILFDAQRTTNKVAGAEATLEELGKTAASLGNSVFFFQAADKLITYRIETGRKPPAMETYLSMLVAAGKDLPLDGQRNDAIQRLKKREKHYKLLGEPAPEFLTVDKWFPGAPVKIADLRGKVVLIDFWATWCAPCFEAFPALTDWHNELSDDGLVILGFTRYYGKDESRPVDEPGELAFLERFRSKQKLPYDFVVGKDQSTQLLYGAAALPTAVLIDRKGTIRYIEAGTSSSRLVEMREMILKLISEK